VSPTADNAGHDEPLLALTDVAAQRVQLAVAKWGTEAPINDPLREQAVLDAVAAKSTQLGINPVRTRAVFTDQIEANKAVRYGLYCPGRGEPSCAGQRTALRVRMMMKVRVAAVTGNVTRRAGR
jgi:chorismate mutase